MAEASVVGSAVYLIGLEVPESGSEPGSLWPFAGSGTLLSKKQVHLAEFGLHLVGSVLACSVAQMSGVAQISGYVVQKFDSEAQMGNSVT